MYRKRPQVLGADLNRSESRRGTRHLPCLGSSIPGRRLLRCGMLIWPMTAMGHSRPLRS